MAVHYLSFHKTCNINMQLLYVKELPSQGTQNRLQCWWYRISGRTVPLSWSGSRPVPHSWTNSFMTNFETAEFWLEAATARIDAQSFVTSCPECSCVKRQSAIQLCTEFAARSSVVTKTLPCLQLKKMAPCTLRRLYQKRFSTTLMSRFVLSLVALTST